MECNGQGNGTAVAGRASAVEARRQQPFERWQSKVDRLTGETRKAYALRIAMECFQQNPEWTEFFRDILGVNGVIRCLFPTTSDLHAFEQSEGHARILDMQMQLRERSKYSSSGDETIRVFTLRVPRSVYTALTREGHDRGLSANQLLVLKALAPLHTSFDPELNERLKQAHVDAA